MARVPLADYSIRNSYLINMSQLCEIMLLPANKGECKSCFVKGWYPYAVLQSRKAMIPVNLMNKSCVFIKTDEKNRKALFGGAAPFHYYQF